MTESEVTDRGVSSRTWELKRVYSWRHLLILWSVVAGTWTVCVFHSLCEGFVLVSAFVLAFFWGFFTFVNFVGFLRFYPVRKITFGDGPDPKIKIETIWRSKSVIDSSQLGEFKSGDECIFIEYRAPGNFWTSLRSTFLSRFLVIHRHQFTNHEGWLDFVQCLNKLNLAKLPIATSSYPPTYPEVPCPQCGLSIPTYEPHCPNCASPR